MSKAKSLTEGNLLPNSIRPDIIYILSCSTSCIYIGIYIGVYTKEKAAHYEPPHFLYDIKSNNDNCKLFFSSSSCSNSRLNRSSNSKIVLSPLKGLSINCKFPASEVILQKHTTSQNMKHWELLHTMTI